MARLHLQTASHDRSPRPSTGDRREIREPLGHCLTGGAAPESFQFRRLRALVAALPHEAERRPLLRALDRSDRPAECARSLLAWAGHLETIGRFDEADFATGLAARICPDDPAIDLHRARVARKAGYAEKALTLYHRALERLSDNQIPLARMARLGCVLVGPDGERGISAILRESIRSGDHESAAVAQEARARRRIGAGDLSGAVRDLLFAAVRYPRAIDRGRVGLALADLLTSRGDLAAARSVLEVVEREALPRQADWARARLLQLARCTGDEIGLRRWAESTSNDLVALLPPRRGVAPSPSATSLHSAIRRLAALRLSREAPSSAPVEAPRN